MTLAEWHVVIDAFIATNSQPEEGSMEDEFMAVLAEDMAVARASSGLSPETYELSIAKLRAFA